MPLDDACAQRKPDPGTRVFIRTVQAREHLKNLVLILGRDTDSVIPDIDPDPIAGLLGPDIHLRWVTGTRKLAGVADQVLEQARQQTRMAGHSR